jgi:hypothetical protein
MAVVLRPTLGWTTPFLKEIVQITNRGRDAPLPLLASRHRRERTELHHTE